MNRKSIYTALIGHIIERYDMALYGYFSTLLAPIFFPSSSQISPIVASLSAFAIGYISRPIGGIIFGYFGDRYGRKIAFIYSVFFMVFPMIVISILPSYKTIGFFAPLIIILCRLMQGLCGGGEFAGAGIYIGESLPIQRKGFGGGLICSTGILGAATGTFLGMIATLPNMPQWTWRLAFLLGGIGTAISFCLRRKMRETPVFQKFNETKLVTSTPIFDVFKSHKQNIFCSILIGGSGHIFLYLAGIYINVIYATELNLEIYKIMAINTLVLLSWVIFSPIAGHVADIIGVQKFMKLTTLLIMVFSYPLFSFLASHLTVWGIISFQILLSFLGACFVAPISSLFVILFPVGQRYSGAGFSITLGQAILGGVTPLLATLLTEFSEDHRSPFIVLFSGALLGFVGVSYIKELEHSSLGFAKAA